MTKRARHINDFVDTITDMAINGRYLRLCIENKQNTPEANLKGQQYLKDLKATLKAHLIAIVENNEEQAEAFMAELGIHWTNEK